ncbi:hypothetical protein LSAT2_023780 [Lamellibrachia satsuma]|nr:hypothetical protein LSAT2_023780 [Lamellibrachia satsuma]
MTGVLGVTCTTCQNSDTCNDVCTCPVGYSGSRCGHKKVLCSAVTCQNGATCTNTDSGYVCQCLVMFTGVLCETEWKFCERDMPCQNGGTCINLPEDKYVCVCPKCGCSTAEPFDNCAIDPTPCAADTCANGGTCEDTMSGFKCHCPFGQYNGRNCENKFTMCDDITCQHGTCEDTENGFYCNCSEHYVGTYCQEQKVLCSAVTCWNGATCTNTDSGYVCQCPVMFTGVLCETEWKFCERDMPCHNGGTCIDLPEDKYVCVCPKCGCSTAEPFDNCTIDEDNICKIANMPVSPSRRSPVQLLKVHRL